MVNKNNLFSVKKLFLGVLAVFIGGGIFASSFAYTPTSQDTANLADLQIRLTTLVIDDNINLWNFYNQLKNLEIDYSSDDRLEYMLNNLKTFMYSKLFALKTKAKVFSKETKEDFLAKYDTGLSIEIDDSLATCTGRYNTLDDISFAYNFPTALTMATWYRESTCAYYLPSNGDGPFQLVNKDYGTGDITEKEFIQTIKDFLSFTKSKFARYEGELSGSLTYTGFDFTGISNFAALYNGGIKSGNIVVPNRTDYLLDGYGDEFSGAIRYGIFPQFLKALDWEVKNNY